MKLFSKDVLARLRLFRLRRQARKHPSPAAWAALSERCLAMGKVEAGYASVEEGLRDFPTSERLHALRRLIQKESLRERVKSLRQSLRRRPDPYLYARLANVFRQLGELSKAESIAEECKTRFPCDENPYLIIGEIRTERFKQELMARDGRLAVENLERAVSLNPDNLKGRMQLAELYAALGANSRALPHLLHLAEATPDDERIRGLIAEVGSRPVEEGELGALLRAAERRRRTPYPFPGGECPAGGGGTPAAVPAADPAAIRRAAAGLFGIRNLKALYVAYEPAGPIEVKEDPSLQADGFSRSAAKILKAAEASSRKMDMGGFAQGFLEGSFGRIVLRRTQGLEVALLLEASVPIDVAAREVDTFFDRIFGSHRIAARARRS
ncbi:MAG: tetratricopeptide repeat protein [Planctomycetes bacterium]|nr:tetratricopeptide repeat protein [Planctomycetota bacterium]